MRIPTATYRLQFSPAFGFRRAREQLAYLQELGISDLYASPLFKARKGSTHGYDVVDQTALNPELGSVEDFAALAEEARRRQMGWLQDIVPNHMAVDGDNGLFLDVLENGSASRYARFFDIDWTRQAGTRRTRVLLPLLGQFFGRALEEGELRLGFGEQGFALRCGALQLPLRIESYREILEECLQQLGEEHPDTVQLRGLLYLIGAPPSRAGGRGRHEQVVLLKKSLWILHGNSPPLRRVLQKVLQAYNGEKGRPSTFSRLEKLLAGQWFRLAFWKVACEEVNYRRFFCINDLVSLRMEHPEAFALAHQLPLRLLGEGSLSGLRVDHIDGLFHPRGYLEQLRSLAPEAYLVVEKVLAPGEPLPDWPVQGTTGYDFLNELNALFCRKANEKAMSAIYGRFARSAPSYPELVVEKKRLILDRHMAGDLDNLVRRLQKLARHYRYGSDLTRPGLCRALGEVLVRLPVYRTYAAPGEFRNPDLDYLRQALYRAREENPGLVNEIDFIGRVLRLDYDEFLDTMARRAWLQFAMRLQQFTAPLTAKGFEDTLLYVYNRLLSLNEVGGAPERFGLEDGEFHDFCRLRRESWPHSLNATSTHDTKRGEDVRARLNVLPDIPQQWRQAVQEWSRMNRPLKKTLGRHKAPDRNDEYFLYQTLVGAWPTEAEEEREFGERLQAYLVKAVREAKVHTAWIKPDQAYEEAYARFAGAILDPKHPFLGEFRPFQKKVAYFGMLNSLAQTLVKITAPGIPDFYQGSELWDLSLVDPDNRRPVDFSRRRRGLREIKREWRRNPQGLLRQLLDHWQDGRIKLFLVYRALAARRRSPCLFSAGDYRPLRAAGQRREHIFAFARQHRDCWAVTVVPRFLAGVTQEGEPPLGDGVWGGTHLELPAQAEWTEALTGTSLGCRAAVRAGEALAGFPVALLLGRPAGIPEEPLPHDEECDADFGD